jgi:uncharacterized sulfatase
MRPGVTTDLKRLMADADSGIRYWGVVGVLIRGADEATACRAELTNALADSSLHVRIAAAEALGRYGTADDLRAALDVLIELADCGKTNGYVATYALEAIDAIGKKAAPLKDRIAVLPLTDPKIPARPVMLASIVNWLQTSLST